MAHEIDQTTGQAAVFVTGEPAWHRLGTVIEQATSSAEAIGLAGLDWHVEQWPVRAFDPHQFGSEARIDEFVANVRTDTRAVIGVVGKRYRVFQNSEAFDFMDALVGDKLAMYETAGSLHGGRRVWMLAAIPKEYRAGADDLIKPYVLLTNTHDGSQALRMIPTTVRVVCQNTLNLAMREAGMDGLTVSHHPRLEILHEKVRSEALSIRHNANSSTVHADHAEGFTSSALDKLRERRAELDPLHDKHYVEDHEAYTALKAIPDKQVDALVDLLTVETITAHLQRRTELVWRLADELGVEMRRYWRPDERWLSGYQKIQLAQLVQELGGPTYAATVDGKKKSELVAELAKLFTDAAEGRLEDAKLAAKVNGWLPSNLREPSRKEFKEGKLVASAA